MKTIMLTGGRGFIGSHMLMLLCEQFPEDTIVNVDSQTYAARRPLYLHRPPNLVEEKVDIRDHLAVCMLIQTHQPATLVHMAAESHVCRSIAGPKDFVTTNVLGTFNLLNEFKEWSGGAGRFVHVSTDEVFGECPGKGWFNEASALMPRNPYAASKASADLFVRAYHETYNMDTVTVRMANNFGPNQHREKLIPRAISRILAKKPVILHGDGTNRREWLFVEDAVRGVYAALKEGRSGQSYCLPGEFEFSNEEMVHMIHNTITDLLPASRYKLEIEYKDDRPTDDRRYAMNGDKAARDLSWKPAKAKSFAQKLRATVEWYLHATMHRGGRRSTVGT